MKRIFGGFTLIETMVVILLLGVMILVVGNLFFSTMKGASKAEITKEIKQNGDYALAVMERTIRNSKEIVACSGQSLQLVKSDGTQTTFNCVNEDGVNKIASDSGRLTGTKVTLGNSCPVVFTCDLNRTPPLVTIFFTLYQAQVTTKSEEAAQVNFSTTVSLRNY